MYKQNIICEQYLFSVEKFSLKKLLCKLRLGILNLEITAGRYDGIPREERLCRLCETGSVEDEMHFVLVCNYFVTERQKFIPRYFYYNPSVPKFAQLMQSQNDVIIRKLSRYVYQSCKKRDLFFRQ